MTRVLKALLWGLGVSVLLVALAAVVVPLYVDPNDFKGPIERQLETRLGRAVDIQGEIGLSVFPWLGLEVGKVTLGNPPGFAPERFAAVDKAEVRVKLLPLLRRQVEADTVTVRGLELRLVRDRAGRTNWEDLLVASGRGVEPPAPAEPAPAPPAAQASGPLPAVSALALGGLDLRDTRIAWSDEASGQQALVEDLDLRTGAIVPGQPFPLELSARVRSTAPEIETAIDLRGRVDAFPDRALYRMRELALEARLRGPALPAQGLELSARGQLEVDLTQQTLKAVPLIASAAGVEGELAIVVEDLLRGPRYSASIDTRETDLRALLERLGAGAPATADPGALTRATLGTRVAGTLQAATVSPLVLRLDDSRLEGQIEVLSLAGPRVQFELHVDRLDLDRYLPPAAPAGGAAPGATTALAPTRTPPSAGPAAAGAAAAGLPVDLLRRLDLAGRLRVDELRVARLRATDVSLALKARDGVLTLDPADASLYQGIYLGRSRLDVRGSEPRLAVDEQLSGVHLGPLLKDVTGRAPVTGVADVSARLEAAGGDAETLRRSLAGAGRFAVRDGTVEGFDLERLIRQAKAAIEGRVPAAGEGPARTEFAELRGTVRIAQGVARSEDLQARSALLRVEGKGSADLVGEELELLLTARVVGTPEGVGGRDLKGLEGVAVPVRVSGPFDRLGYRVDLDEVLKAGAQNELQRKAEEAIDKRLGGEAGEKAKDLLRGLFR